MKALINAYEALYELVSNARCCDHEGNRTEECGEVLTNIEAAKKTFPKAILPCRGCGHSSGGCCPKCS